jgi:predicted Zn finger-like uncharacterized protein
MALITRCPNCATTFRVTPLHLQAHGGDVRCGRCAQIFNGFSSLATIQEPEAADLPKTTVADTPDNTSEAESVKNLLSSPSPSRLSDQEVSPPAPSHKIAETITEVPDPHSSAAGEPAPQIWDVASAPENYMPESHAFDAVQPRKNSFAWGFASLFLLVVLGAQAIYFYRAELAVIAPDARPYLEQYCKLLHCTIPLPQNSGLLNIESSEMQTDAQQAGVITLTATVRNYAPYPQVFPSFELTLTDPQDRPLASRIFAPEKYLEKNVNPSGVIAPDYEFNVRLYLDSGNLNAAGYRLSLFYPAA